jgi:hypothetical protein
MIHLGLRISKALENWQREIIPLKLHTGRYFQQDFFSYSVFDKLSTSFPSPKFSTKKGILVSFSTKIPNLI